MSKGKILARLSLQVAAVEGQAQLLEALFRLASVPFVVGQSVLYLIITI